MQTNIHVERASLEDLQQVWSIAEVVTGSEAQRGMLMRAVNARQCLIARQGWDVVGYALRKLDFLGYPMLYPIGVHHDADLCTVTRHLITYAENTNKADRLFLALRQDNIRCAQLLQDTLAYQPSGTLNNITPDEIPMTIYVKFFS